MLSLEDLTPAAREKAVMKLIDDTKAYIKRRGDFQASVERGLREKPE